MSLSRSAPTLLVEIGGQFAPNAQVLSIVQNVGSRGGHSATLQIRGVLRQSSVLQDVFIKDLFVDQDCKITVSPYGPPDPQTGDPISRVLFWGKIIGSRVSFSGNNEQILLDASLRSHMLGEKTAYRATVAVLQEDARNDRGWQYYTPTENILYRMVFNPSIDGVSQPNMWAGGQDPDDQQGSGNDPCFVDVDSINPLTLTNDRKRAEGVNDDPFETGLTVSMWTPAHAVYYVCRLLNSAEKYVRNPSWTSLSGLVNAGNIRNLEISPDQHLDQVLNNILEPFGYDWRVLYLREEDQQTGQEIDYRQIECYRRRSDLAVNFNLQRWGEYLDTQETALKSLNVNYEPTNRAANYVTGFGSKLQYEASIELRAAWPAQYDTWIKDEWGKLKKDAKEWEANPELKNVWRKWAANEGGDYTGTRPWFNFAYDMHQISESFRIRRRRTALPMTTTDEDGKPLGDLKPGVKLEWYDSSDPFNPVWRSVMDLFNSRWEVVDGEIAVLYMDETPPTVFRAKTIGTETNPENIKMRLTATFEADDYVFAFAEDAQPNIQDLIELVFANPGGYRTRVVSPNSAFFPPPNDRETRGEDAIGLVVDDLLEMNRGGMMGGNAVLDGIDFNLDGYLGAPVWEVQPRNINFKMHDSEFLLPEVTSIRWSPQKQETECTLEFVR